MTCKLFGGDCKCKEGAGFKCAKLESKNGKGAEAAIYAMHAALSHGNPNWNSNSDKWPLESAVLEIHRLQQAAAAVVPTVEEFERMRAELASANSLNNDHLHTHDQLKRLLALNRKRLDYHRELTKAMQREDKFEWLRVLAIRDDIGDMAAHARALYCWTQAEAEDKAEAEAS